jgi:hypothetical protein
MHKNMAIFPKKNYFWLFKKIKLGGDCGVDE